ncbi:MAG: hypothetical protein IH997_01700, partial [Proteobacteria bacterium]|nr:hypothetical protein [Pseudomonadota bacterium]
GSLDIVVAPEQTGLAAERITLLPPGAYAVRQALAFPGGGDAAALRWTAVCLGGGGEIWRHLAPVRPARGTYRAQISIPPGCGAQRWRLVASAAEGVAQARILHFSIVGAPSGQPGTHF